MIDRFEDGPTVRQLERDAFLEALDALEVSELTDAQLNRLADILDKLQSHVDQEYMDRDTGDDNAED